MFESSDSSGSPSPVSPHHHMRIPSVLGVLVLAATQAQSLSPVAFAQQADRTAIRLPRDPALSPDGKSLAFAWQGDLWTAPIEGGDATRLTVHPSNDSQPQFHPSGELLYFRSNRDGGNQIFSIGLAGGPATQITFDSSAKSLLHVTADGNSLVLRQSTDRGWHYSERDRIFLLDLAGEQPRRMLFDAGVRDGALSSDGSRVVFERGRSAWNRKGYQGPQAAQLWLADLAGEQPELGRLDEDRENFQNIAAMSPMFDPSGEQVYFLSDPDGVFNVYRMDLASGEVEQVSDVGSLDGSDDGVAFPSLSADGKTMLVRRRFDLLRLDTDSGKTAPIELFALGDGNCSPLERATEDRASAVAFTSDGKQLAFVAGSDVWIMDRILKEPVRVTHDAHVETSLVFSDDDTRLFFVSDAGGEVDIWEATNDREDGIWWLAEEFALRQVTNDPEAEGQLKSSPTGSHLAFTKGTDLFAMDADGSDHRLVADLWSQPDFDWSPDGHWIAFATQDDNYNSDVYVVPLDGTREAFNISRHPDRDSGPRWSGDGKWLAWVGRRDGEEADIYYVELAKATDEATERDELLEQALEAMKDKKSKGGKSGGKGNKETKEKPVPEAESQAATEEADDTEQTESKEEPEEDLVQIDFDGLTDRIGRIRNSDSFESSLIWFGDGSRLGFSATVDAKRGFYTVDFPRPQRPERLTEAPLSANRWLSGSKEFVGHTGGVPASMSSKGDTKRFEFNVRLVRDWRAIRQIAFDQAWRNMRDRFYDEAFNNRDWEQIRVKYRDVAAQALGAEEFSELCNLMLGELNASHMGHRPGSDPLPQFDAQNEWSPTTVHLGLRFDPSSPGPGLLVESVIPGSPCDRERSFVEAGETLLSFDGQPVGPDIDLYTVMTLQRIRDVNLRVRGTNGEEREVTVRPTPSVAGLLYDEWVEDARAQVEELSGGQLGYLHIRGMNFASFRQMEEDLYHAGVGKDGLILDVRFNGGGSTADHVLTALTQPMHAITRSRGSGEGYPQDRKIYASWDKPIVLMCNEHSFSNAEIVSHAVKHIGRGKLVGMRTAGGVISTGSANLVDGSSIRMPTRGWYLAGDGSDMELNGCLPDLALWNEPDGDDRQLAKAVEVLLEDVATEAAKPKVKLVPAAELRR